MAASSAPSLGRRVERATGGDTKAINDAGRVLNGAHVIQEDGVGLRFLSGATLENARCTKRQFGMCVRWGRPTRAGEIRLGDSVNVTDAGYEQNER